MSGRRKVLARLAAVLTLAAGVAACSPPSSTFVASPEDDLVLKLPRSWSTVRDGPSVDSTTGQPDGGWQAVFDGSRDPDVKHLDLNTAVHAPVAYAQVSVLTAQQASGMDGDKLRDLLLPFTAATRAQYATDPRAKTFHELADYDVRGPGGSGVHIVFSYDLGHGREVFDQIAMLGSQRTRVYVLLVRCDQACYDSHKTQISDVVSSFTVKVP
jgi:hypothetical protein